MDLWVVWVIKCAGNRRTAMSKTRKVKGVGWDVSAIGNGLLLNSGCINSFLFYDMVIGCIIIDCGLLVNL